MRSVLARGGSPPGRQALIRQHHRHPARALQHARRTCSDAKASWRAEFERVESEMRPLAVRTAPSHEHWRAGAARCALAAVWGADAASRAPRASMAAQVPPAIQELQL